MIVEWINHDKDKKIKNIGQWSKKKDWINVMMEKDWGCQQLASWSWDMNPSAQEKLFHDINSILYNLIQRFGIEIRIWDVAGKNQMGKHERVKEEVRKQRAHVFRLLQHSKYEKRRSHCRSLGNHGNHCKLILWKANVIKRFRIFILGLINLIKVKFKYWTKFYHLLYLIKRRCG